VRLEVELKYPDEHTAESIRSIHELSDEVYAASRALLASLER